MKPILSFSVVAGLVSLILPPLWAAEAKEHRVVTISTICLLDDDQHRTADYVLGEIHQAARRGRHDLIVVPLTPFLSFREGHVASDLSKFAGLARDHQMNLVIALNETAKDGRSFCTSVLFGRDGHVVGKYRKTHALADDAMTLGHDLPVFRTDIGVVGLTLSTDFYFPEVYGVLWMKGAEILVWQHSPERFREHFQWVPLLKARALDSRAHLVTAMYADPRTYITNRHEIGMQGTAWGRSMILNRVGTAIADTGYEDGIATATIDLDKRKRDPYSPWKRDENVFLVNNLGDRKAFRPLAEPWTKPELPTFKKRTARIAVGYFWGRDSWRADNVPEAMFRVLDAAEKSQPDFVLLSEMSARDCTETTREVVRQIAERAKRMNAYIMIVGVDVGEKAEPEGRRSHAWLWDRKGEVVFKQPIYWTRGYPEIRVYDTDFARIGVHICGDAYIGEIDRVSALKGAEIIFDGSQMWGADGYNNELMLRARAIDNGCWLACAHWNSSDPGLRSLVVDPYGYVVAASHFQQEGVVFTDIDFSLAKVYYAGRKTHQPKRGNEGIPSYYTEDIPEQRPGWREMIFARRRPELYGILPTTNDVTRKYRPPEPAR
ncbi:MAG: carbon-nitrogen hydrolase family protein [Planctomycetes bacterium]|nr:carbon-nitrogen hydrolase family protein [Planctomycetota bacterium]MBL7041295.1 carbon-nitrogen hydrolase family protein [Pirellulaceae bacterium]